MKLTTIAFLCISAPCLAQSLVGPPAGPPTPPPPKPTAPAPAFAPIKIGGVTISGTFRTRLETWDWFQPDSGDNTYPFSGNYLRLGLSQSRETWDWNAEFAIPLLLGLPENPIGSGTQGALGMGANYLTSNDRNRNTAMIFPRQLYVRFTQLGGSKAHALKLGRFDFSDGSETTPKNASLAAIKRDRINQRLIGGFGFTHVGRSFDGLQYSYNKPSGNFTFVGALPTRGVFQTDGWGWNSTAVGYASYTKPWSKKKYASETRVFALYYDDWRQVLKTDTRPVAVRRADTANLHISTFGGHSLHAVDTGAGALDLLLWGAAQTGRWGVQDHRASAFDIEAGFQPKILPKLKPWFRGGFYTGSGDNNPNDNQHETFFQVLPTPRPFARFPFFNLMNNRDRFGILILRPHSKVTVSGEFHALALSNPNDFWYVGGGVYQPWSFGYVGRASGGRKSLANLYDTSLEYRVHPRCTLNGYFGYAQGRAVMAAIYPKGKDARFGYLEASYRF
jgi:hypothetical protein